MLYPRLMMWTAKTLTLFQRLNQSFCEDLFLPSEEQVFVPRENCIYYYWLPKSEQFFLFMVNTTFTINTIFLFIDEIK